MIFFFYWIVCEREKINKFLKEHTFPKKFMHFLLFFFNFFPYHSNIKNYFYQHFFLKFLIFIHSNTQSEFFSLILNL